MCDALAKGDVRRLLESVCKKAGSRGKWARAHGIVPQYVDAVINGRAPGPQILKALGLKRLAIYMPLPKKKKRFDLAEQVRVLGADSLLPDWKPGRG